MSIPALNTFDHLTARDIAAINRIVQLYGRTYRAAALVRRYLAALEARQWIVVSRYNWGVETYPFFYREAAESCVRNDSCAFLLINAQTGAKTMERRGGI